MKKQTQIDNQDIAPRKSTRRQFLVKTGAGLASTGAFALKAGTSFGNPDVTFDHGVASGDPLNDRVIIWTRVSGLTMGDVSVTHEVALDSNFTRIVKTGNTRANAERDYTVKIDVDGLSSGTIYYYRFRSGGSTSLTGRTKTLPEGNVSHLRYAVCTCSDYSHGYFQAYARIADREDLDFVIHLGDYIYEYGNAQNGLEGNGYNSVNGGSNLDAEGGATYGNFRKVEPDGNVVTLSDYRKRYAQYHRDPDLIALHRTHALISIWDDHDFADNARQGGALNHSNATQGLWEIRKRNAEQAYFEWLPIREDLSGITRKDLAQQMYRSFSIGNLADLFMLEGRVHGKSKQVDPNILNGMFFRQTGDFADANRTILGTDAEQTFYQDLKTSNAKWKLIGNGVLMTQIVLEDPTGLGAYFGLSYHLGKNNDAWDGYDPARQRFYKAITSGNNGDGIQNVVVMSGDLHFATASNLTENPWRWKIFSGYPCRGAEIMPPSVTSPSGPWLTSLVNKLITGVLYKMNRPIQYVELGVHGYLVVDITPERMRSEWWYLSESITAPVSGEYLGKAFEMKDGHNYLSKA